MFFAGGGATHVDNPPPGDTTLTFDFDGRQVDEIESIAIAVRDLFGNEYETRYSP